MVYLVLLVVVLFFIVLFFYFFFFKQKTAYEMRISDWSSDVCSSDLASPVQPYTDRRFHVPDGMPAQLCFYRLLGARAVGDITLHTGICAWRRMGRGRPPGH